jgi:hypothetical protein
MISSLDNHLRTGAFFLAIAIVFASAATAGSFPEVPGFTKQDEPRRYEPDNLFEYINGDAFSYLNFGFEEVAVQDYVAEESAKLVIDIFRHSSANNGFGIYTHERPAEAQPLEIGVEGYYSGGKLNFLKGRYYVKLHAHEAGDGIESIMMKAAAEIANTIEGEASLPATAAAFPREGMIPNSLRYMGGGFLGHRFLHSAFVADYRQGDGESVQLFVIESADAAASAAMLKEYLALVDSKGGDRTLDNGIYRFKDPYHAYRGAMNIRQKGNYLFGLFSDDHATADSYLKALEAGLEERDTG